jgi:pSer/pThr/pTyr-binding forkhead associated (FHA) protein/outer membrane biosynthesis protein TonB
VRALSQTERTETDRIGSQTPEAVMAGAAADVRIAANVCVYRGSNCILNKDFNRSHLSIGRSLQSDIVLQDSGISRHHVDIYIENQKIFLFVAPQKKALLINGQSVKAALIDPDDTIELGPYAVKIRNTSENDSPPFGEDLRYQVVFEGKMKKGHPPERVADKLKKWLKHDDQKTAAFIAGNPVVIKTDLNLQEAIEFKKVFEETGAVGQVQAIIESSEIDAAPHNGKVVTHLFNETDIAPQNAQSAAQADISKCPATDSAVIPLSAVVEDEDEDDEDYEAAFSLKEMLSTFGTYDQRVQNTASGSERALGVFKFQADTVIDVCYLNSGESYFTNTSTGRFRLAQKNGSGKGYLYFNEGFSGTVKTKQSDPVAITDLIVGDNLYRKRKGIYRFPIIDSGEVIVNDGCHDYLIRSIWPSQSPAVPDSPPEKKLSWKHGAFSLMVHLLFLAVLTILPVSQIKDTPEPETRFVQVDPQLLEKLQENKKPVKKPPPKTPKKTKPAPQPVKKKEPVKKKALVKKKPAKVSKKPLKTAKRQITPKSNKKVRNSGSSKHPKAGGGYGKGNTKNRNVNQVGILSMLGDSKGAKVQPAVTDVTNLDAVKSANSGQTKFKVGGIKGKLGTSTVSVSGDDVVATKGNSQVLRSYGASGDGQVAALEKGDVGQKKVMGMVQARLNKSVKIRGGMSREAVKRVIEQHLDEITYCYETALISNPSIKGKITMEWKILMSGTVGEVRIKSSTIKSPEIYGCIKLAIKTWQFPKPIGNEVVVSYPFIFDIVGF